MIEININYTDLHTYSTSILINLEPVSFDLISTKYNPEFANISLFKRCFSLLKFSTVYNSFPEES